MKEIEHLWAFLAEDTPEEEGIVAVVLPHVGTAPLITSKDHVANKMKSLAQQVAIDKNTTVRLVRFTRIEVLEVYYPAGGKTQ